MDRVFLSYKDWKLIADGTQNDLLFNFLFLSGRFIQIWCLLV